LKAACCSERTGEAMMLDVMMLALGIGMFIAFWGYTALCEVM
jgi:hypothetical protein